MCNNATGNNIFCLASYIATHQDTNIHLCFFVWSFSLLLSFGCFICKFTRRQLTLFSSPVHSTFREGVAKYCFLSHISAVMQSYVIKLYDKVTVFAKTEGIL